MRRALGGAVLLVAMALPQAAFGVEKTFSVADYCGPSICAQVWNVPRHVTSATFDVYGGQGAGSIYWPDAHGGLGGRATATIDVTPGEQYLILVGKAGRYEDPMTFTTNGGRGSVVKLGERRIIGAGGGGGGSATDGGPGGAQTSSEFWGNEGGASGSLDGPGEGGDSWGPPGTKFEAGVRSGDGLVTVTYDPFPHDTAFESGPRAITNDNTPTFSFSADEAGVSFQCFDEFKFGTCSGPGQTHTMGPLSDGPHTIAVTSTDTEGNTDPTPATRTFTVDTTPPVVRVTDRPKKTVKTGGKQAKVRVAFKSTERDTAFECRLDKAAYRPCASPYSVRAKARRSGAKHRISVRGTDAAGNAAASGVEFEAIRKG